MRRSRTQRRTQLAHNAGTAAIEAVLYSTFMIIPVLILARGISAMNAGAIDAAAGSRYIVIAESIAPKRYEDRVSTRTNSDPVTRLTTAEHEAVLENGVAFYPALDDSFAASLDAKEGESMTAPRGCSGLDTIAALGECAKFGVDAIVDLGRKFTEIKADTAGFPGSLITNEQAYPFREAGVIYQPSWTQQERFTAFRRSPMHYDDRPGIAHQAARCQWCVFKALVAVTQLRSLVQPTNPQDMPDFPDCFNDILSAFTQEEMEEYERLAEERGKQQEKAERAKEISKRLEEIEAESREVSRQAQEDRQRARDEATRERERIRADGEQRKQDVRDSELSPEEKQRRIDEIDRQTDEQLATVDRQEREQIEVINEREKRELDALQKESEGLSTELRNMAQ